MRRARAVARRTEPGVELVVGLGHETEEAARPYAHLTRRRCRVVCRAEELPSRPAPSVVLAL